MISLTTQKFQDRSLRVSGCSGEEKIHSQQLKTVLPSKRRVLSYPLVSWVLDCRIFTFNMPAFNFRLSNIPPVTKATLVATFLLSLLSAAFRYRLYMAQSITSAEQIVEQQLAVPFLTVVPATSYLFPWTFLTASFVQLNIFSVWLPPWNELTKSSQVHW